MNLKVEKMNLREEYMFQNQFNDTCLQGSGSRNDLKFVMILIGYLAAANSIDLPLPHVTLQGFAILT